MTTCTGCGQSLPDDARFCGNCGTLVPPPQPIPPAPAAAPPCPSCGQPLDPGAAFCANCGFRVAPPAPPSPQPASSSPFGPSRAPAPLAPTVAANCANCGTPLVRGPGFCGNCGAPSPLAGVAGGLAPVSAGAPGRPPANRNLYFAGAIALGLALAVGGYFLFKGDGKKSTLPAGAPQATTTAGPLATPSVAAGASPSPAASPAPSPTPSAGASPSPAPSPSPQGARTIFSDTFDNNGNSWPVGNYTETRLTGSRQVSGGKYTFQATVQPNALWTEEPKMNGVADFTLRTDARRINGPVSAMYGVKFRSRGEGMYLFAVRDDQFFLVAFWDQKVAPTPLIDWTTTTAIRAGQVNLLEVIASGSRFTFNVNGQKVGEISDTRLPNGNAGVAMALFNPGDSALFEYDNFTMTAP